jgi:hypothetical protein
MLVTAWSRVSDEILRVEIPGNNKASCRIEFYRRAREYGYPVGYWVIYSVRH